MVVVAYGLILPQSILDVPRLGCLNIHASLLPRWRGAAPIQRAILAGDTRTGVTIMKMDAGLDTGPMLLVRSLEIGAKRECREPARPSRRAWRGGDSDRDRLMGCGQCRAGRPAARWRDLRGQDQERGGRDRLEPGRRARLRGRCAPSIPGQWPKLAGRGSSCGSGKPSRGATGRARRRAPSSRQPAGDSRWLPAVDRSRFIGCNWPAAMPRRLRSS